MTRSGWFHRFGLLALVMMGTAGRGLADENPFGLPRPVDPQKPGAVLLHGGGYSQHDKSRSRVRKKFLELASRYGPAKLLIMPSEDDLQKKTGTREKFEARLRQPEQYGHWVDLAPDSFAFVYRDPVGDPDDTQIVKLLDQATGIWMPEYDQEWLPNLFVDDDSAQVGNVVLALRRLISRGGVVGGLGGGMACLPETIIADNKQGDGDWIQPQLSFGLGLLDGVVVDKDFESVPGRLERLTYLLRRSPSLDRLRQIPGIQRRTIGIGVCHSTTAILQRNQLEVLGDHEVHVFLKGNGDRTLNWFKLSDGQTLTVLGAGSPQAGPDPKRDKHDQRNVNPFGLPDDNTQDDHVSGTVVLHGGGSNDEMIVLFPTLSEKPQPRLVHCPAATDRYRPISDAHEKILMEQFQKKLFREWRQLEANESVKNLTFITARQVGEGETDKLLGPLRQADAVWFGGGSQMDLARLFVGPFNQPTKFQLALADVLKRGGVVGGTSAGLAIMPAIVIVPSDEHEVADVSPGFGLLKNVLAEQHFDARHGRIKRMTNLFWSDATIQQLEPTARATDKIGLAVEERCALIIRGDTRASFDTSARLVPA